MFGGFHSLLNEKPKLVVVAYLELESRVRVEGCLLGFSPVLPDVETAFSRPFSRGLIGILNQSCSARQNQNPGKLGSSPSHPGSSFTLSLRRRPSASHSSLTLQREAFDANAYRPRWPQRRGYIMPATSQAPPSRAALVRRVSPQRFPR